MIHLHRLGLWKLYPFDSLRSLRVTTTYIHYLRKEPEEDSHPERKRRRSWSRMGIAEVGLCIDDFTCRNSRKTVTLSGDGEAKRNRRSRMGITLVRSSMDDFICKYCSAEVIPVRLATLAQGDGSWEISLQK